MVEPLHQDEFWTSYAKTVSNWRRRDVELDGEVDVESQGSAREEGLERRPSGQRSLQLQRQGTGS
eukprot:1000638-Amorphochlora_amoeboformis.AAC.1